MNYCNKLECLSLPFQSNLMFLVKKEPTPWKKHSMAPLKGMLLAKHSSLVTLMICYDEKKLCANKSFFFVTDGVDKNKLECLALSSLVRYLWVKS
jgi:hypothetical protein